MRECNRILVALLILPPVILQCPEQFFLFYIHTIYLFYFPKNSITIASFGSSMKKPGHKKKVSTKAKIPTNA